MEPTTLIIIMLISLGLEAFFSGSEIGIVSADRANLLHQAEQGSRGAALALEMLKKPEWLLSTTLVGTNLAIVTNTTCATILAVQLFGPGYGWLAAVIVAPLSWVFGEIVAKSAFQQHADSLTPKVIGVIKMVSIIFYPILIAFAGVTRVLTGASGQGESSIYTIREEIASLMQMKSIGGDIEPEEQQMIHRIFKFSEVPVSDVLTPLIDVTGIPHTATCGEARKVAAEKFHRRLTVYHDRVDNIIGIIDSLDLLGLDEGLPIDSLITPVRFVPGSQNIEELLVSMRGAAFQMAVVVDEYGGAEGIVTIEDLLEEVVGEIDDEYDPDEPNEMVKTLGHRKLQVNARIPIDELAEATPVKLPKGNYETLGGFLVDLVHDIPEIDSVVRYRRYTFVIEQVTDKVIQQVNIEW